MQSLTVDFSTEQQELWTRVVGLWNMAKNQREREIRSALHPDYVGWDMSKPLPHNRDSAVRSVCDASAKLDEYELRPFSVQIYGGHVGVAHYSYFATVTPKGGPSTRVTGKWSEVYVRQAGVWTMISVSGRPDLPRGAADAESA